MTLTQLQYVLAVDTHRHFAIAAQHCYVTQPTLSMQIQKLEEELDIILFDRSKKPVTPTEIGKKVIEQARVIINETERINEIIEIDKGTFKGQFRLGVIPTIAAALLPKFIKNFLENFPELHIVIEEIQTNAILEKLRNDMLDAAIMATPLNESGLIEQALYQEPFYAFIPEGHRLQKEVFVVPEELKLSDLLLLNEGHCFRNNVVNLCRYAFTSSGEELPITLESGSMETLVKLSKQGYGMTLLPYFTAKELSKADQQLHLKPFKKPQPSREVSLVYSRAQLKQHLIQELVKIIQSIVPKSILKEEHQIVSPIKKP